MIMENVMVISKVSKTNGSKMKIAFDVHGILDTYEVFRELLNILLFANNQENEIHILSGIKEEEAKPVLLDLGIRYDEYFSITDFLVKKGLITYDDKGMPWSSDSEAWDRAKSDYCRENKIDILIDDSDVYKKYFGGDHPTKYLQLHNPNRKIYYPRAKTE